MIFFLEFNTNSNRDITMKFIYSVDRRDSTTTIYEDLVDCVHMRRTMSDYVVGFDLVDEEDR